MQQQNFYTIINKGRIGSPTYQFFDYGFTTPILREAPERLYTVYPRGFSYIIKTVTSFIN